MVHIPFSQSYFAIQARKNELIEDRMRSRCDAALFGGDTTQAMKGRFGMTGTRLLADSLPTQIIAAQNLATEISNHNIGQDNPQCEHASKVGSCRCHYSLSPPSVPRIMGPSHLYRSDGRRR